MSIRETTTYSFDHQLFTNPFPPVNTEESRQINEVDVQLDAEEAQQLSSASHLPFSEKQELAARIRVEKIRLREHLASMIARKFPYEKVQGELYHSKYVLSRSFDAFFAKRTLNGQIERQVEDEFNTFEHRLHEVDDIAMSSLSKIQTPVEKKIDEDPLWAYKWDAVHRNMVTAKMGAKVTETIASALSVPISAVCNFPAPNACKNVLDVGKIAARGAIQGMGLEKAVEKASDVIDALQSSDQAIVQNLETQFLIPREQGKEYAKEAFQSLAMLPTSIPLANLTGKVIGKITRVNPVSKPTFSNPPRTVVLSRDVTIYSPPSSSYFKNRRIVQRTPLVPEDIGINSDFFHRRGIHQLRGWIEPSVNGTLKVEFDLIFFSELNSSWLSVVNRLKDIAKANQAKTLHFEAQIINEQLLNVMSKRYGEPIIKSVTTEYRTVSKQVFLIPVE
jgi:flagellar biosynthesis/type III secretory pathway chaperone